jgi:hypothetical protein
VQRTYGGDVIADFDNSDTGPSHYVGAAERLVLRSPSGLADPPLVTYMEAEDALFVAGLPSGDPTVYSYTARIRTTHFDPDFGHDVHLALLSGALNSDADYAALRQSWLTDREAKVAADLATAATLISAAGGTVLETGSLIPEIEFTADQTSLAAILASVQVEVLVTPGHVWSMHDLTENGTSLRLVTRTDAYSAPPGYDVDGDGNLDRFEGATQKLAIVELLRNYHPDHPGMFRVVPTGALEDRVVERAACDQLGRNCSGFNVFGDDGFHPLAVASVAAGDLRGGQDATVISPADRDAGTFQAPSLKIGEFALQAIGLLRTYRNALQEVSRSTQNYPVANLSWGVFPFASAERCLGKSAVAHMVGDLFESGVLPVVAAGNQLATSISAPITRCSLHDPADSFQALAVAGEVDGFRWLSTTDPNIGSSNGESSWSGRSGVGIMAPARYDGMYYFDRAKPSPNAGYSKQFVTPAGSVAHSTPLIAGEDCNNRDDDGDGLVDEGFPDDDGDGTPDCAVADEIAGTSLSAPAVAGAALVYREFYLKKYSRLIDDPGIGYVNLLLRGDRFGAPSGVSGFSDVTGAGRLEMWMTQTPALTPSWGWGTGRVCVADGEQVTIKIRNGMPADVKGLRAVAWWSDQWDQRDQIDLSVLRNGTTAASDATSLDVKRRVNLPPSDIVGGATYDLRLVGDDIRGRDPACGNREKLVYWGFLYADELGF